MCEKWGLLSTVIGKVTDTGRFVVREGDEIVADMPAATLAHDAPEYDPAKQPPSYLDEVQAFDPMTLSHPTEQRELESVFLRLLISPNIASRRWIYRQYDHQVMLNTIVLPGGDAAVLRIKDHEGRDAGGRGIAATTDCNGRYCYLDPYTGAQAAFVEAVRNVACVGARPAAITDCLNFGNPEKPGVFWTFHEAVRGLADACWAFAVPVISGNVSFYNESFGKAIYPTPTVGMVGVIEDVSKATTTAFDSEDDVIVLLGETAIELGGSEYLAVEHGIVGGRPPAVDLDHERALADAVVAAIEREWLKSAHDCSEGGVAMTLAECCIAGDIGADVHLGSELPPVAALFSETHGRILVTVRPGHLEDVQSLVSKHGIAFRVIGTVGGTKLRIGGLIELDVAEIAEVWETALEKAVQGE